MEPLRNLRGAVLLAATMAGPMVTVVYTADPPSGAAGATPTASVAAASADKERELLAVLRSDAPASEKAVTCKYLAIYGTSQAVPDLAPLLADERFSSWARIALEAIPGAAAEEALRKSLDTLKGKLLVGVINSIGVRRDAGSVDYLSAKLRDADPEVAAAAAVALGRIGSAQAARAIANVPWAAGLSQCAQPWAKDAFFARNGRWLTGALVMQSPCTTPFAEPTCRSNDCSKQRAEPLWPARTTASVCSSSN